MRNRTLLWAPLALSLLGLALGLTTAESFAAQTPNSSIVVNASDGSVCREQLVNGSFETAEGWELPDTAHRAVYTTSQAHSGARSLSTGILSGEPDVFS